MVVYLGRNADAERPDWGFISPGQMRGYTPNTTTQHMWVYQFGIWGGKYTPESASNVTARIGLYATNAGNPAGRLGYSDAFTVSAAMADSISGASHTANVGLVDETEPAGATFSGIPIASGYQYHLSVLGTVGYLAYGMAGAASVSGTNEYFYTRSGLGQPPPAPFGAYTSTFEGHMSIWAAADENVAPTKPTGLEPEGPVIDTTPTMSAPFVDGNENRGDYLNQYRVQVRRTSDSVSMWNATITATSAERSAGAISRNYGGTTLVAGISYQWRCQMSDHFDTWSAWSDWTAFTPAAAGTVTLDGTPTGWTTDTTPDFQGRWHHATGTTMKRVQIEILNASGGTALQRGADFNIADVASSAAPGTLFTLLWADAGLVPLANGTNYQYRMRGHDGTAWSAWGNKRPFNTNAPPTVPSLKAPADGIATSARPLLEFTATDTDATLGSLSGYVEIMDLTNTVLGTYATTWHAGSGTYRLQTTSTHLPAIDVTRRWRAYTYDGYLYSGGATTSATATRSASRTFTYANVPTVTITGPVDPVTAANPAVTWTCPGQVTYRVRLFRSDDTLLYDTGVITGAALSHTIPGGYLRNGLDYYAVVSCTDSSTLTGDSSPWLFGVDYTPADGIQNLAISPVRIGTDLWDSAIALTWDQTAYAVDVWQNYTVRCNGVIVGVITSPSQNAFTYYTPPSGTECTFEVTQSILTDTDLLTSDPVTGSAMVQLGGVVIVGVSNPETLRTTMRYTRERTFDRTISEAVYEPVNGALPTTVRTPTYFRSPAFDARVFADDAASSATRRTELEVLDRAGGTVCYRDNHGRKIYATIPKLTITDQVPEWYTVSLELREEAFDEGVGDD